MNSEIVTVYVQLLNEGVATARPVEAKLIENNIYQLLTPEDYDAEDEEWEFLPGSIVRCEEVDWGEGKTLLLAIKKT